MIQRAQASEYRDMMSMILLKLKQRAALCILFTTLAGSLSFISPLAHADASSSSQANPTMDIESLRTQAYDYLMQATRDFPGRSEIVISSLDHQLRLDNCPTPLEISPQGRSDLIGRVTLRVECPAQGWFIYLSATIKHYEAVVTARQSIPRDTPITQNMLSLEEMDTSRIRDRYFTDPKALQGMRTRWPIRAGDVIAAKRLLAANAVNEGDQVIIHAQVGSLEVKMLGEALEDGQVGDQVRIKNTRSGKVLRARVIAKGVVQVGI